MNKRDKISLTSWGYIFAVLLVIGLLNIGVIVTDRMIYGGELKILFPLIHEFTGSVTIIFLMPLLFWLFDTYPLKKKTLLYRVPLYLIASALFGAGHTMLMTISRMAIYNIWDLGVYDYGNILYRFLMEYQKQFLTFWVIYFIYFFINSYKEKQREKLRLESLEKELTKARLQTLQMQINPHFFFNTLNLISSKMYDDPRSADSMIANLSDLLRLSLKENNSEEHTVKKEKELIELYLKIMKARFDNKLNVNFQAHKSVEQALIPWFLLQPIIENSIKYGMETLDKLEININIFKKENNLLVEIIDNGPGINENSEVLNEGVGLSNTKERLEKLYGDNHNLVLENIDSGGLKVAIEFPYKENDK